MASCKRELFGRLCTTRKRSRKITSNAQLRKAQRAIVSRMSFSRWVVRQWRGGREMTRGARTREETTEENEREVAEEREVRENWGIARCSAKTLDCPSRKMRAIVTTAVDTSLLISPSAIYRFCSHFSLFDPQRILCMNSLSLSEVLFIIGPFRVLRWHNQHRHWHMGSIHPSVWLILVIFSWIQESLRIKNM